MPEPRSLATVETTLALGAVPMAPPPTSPRSGRETKVRFLLAGGLNTLVGLAIFPLLMWSLRPLHIHYMAVLLLGQVVSIVFAYATQKAFVFRTRGDHAGEFLRFSSFYLGYFAFNAAALPALVEIGHANPIIAQFCISLGVVVCSYFWHSRITFAVRGRGR